MYGIIERNYGVKIDCVFETLPDNVKTFLRQAYHYFYYTELRVEWRDDWTPPEEMTDGDYHDWLENGFGDMSFGYSSYSGEDFDDDPPIGVGVNVDSFPYWEVNAIVAAAREDDVPESVIEKFNDKIPQTIRDLLKENGIELGYWWMCSTS